MACAVLPPPWYAAVQANESTLPLPSAGYPQPMFGIVPGADCGYAVGTGYYSSGGTPEASQSLGVGAGQTVQALFPSVCAGMAAFDCHWQTIQGCVDAAQAGDFSAFLVALAPHYAGPGEVQRWPAQVLSHYDPNANLELNIGAGQQPVGPVGPGQGAPISGVGGVPGPGGQIPTPTFPLIPSTPAFSTPQEAQPPPAQGRGWDNLRQWLGDDQLTLYLLYQQLRGRTEGILGGRP